MKAVTLRDIPRAVADRIERQAADTGTSLNRAVIAILSEAIGTSSVGNREFVDLDHLIGRWSIEESRSIESVIDEQRIVDKELWR